MEYRPNQGIWSNVFAVPAAVADRYLRTADEKQIKVLLWALRHSGEYFNDEMISAGSGVSEIEAENAMSFWIAAGVLNYPAGEASESTVNDFIVQNKATAQRKAAQDPANTIPQSREKYAESVSAAEKSAEANPQPSINSGAFTAPAKPDGTSVPANENTTQANARKLERALGKRMIRPDPGFLATRMQEDENIITLIREAESLLGKTISPTLSAVLLAAYDDMNMPSEVIITLLSYCNSIGKTSIQYIESVVEDWGRSGIDSMQLAEQKLLDIDKHSRAWKVIMRLFAIPYRQPSQKENDFCYSWIYEMGHSEDIIKEAYERCIDNTGKMQFSYINKILSSWYAGGVKTIGDVLDFEAKSNGKKGSVASSSINYDDLENFGVFADMDK